MSDVLLDTHAFIWLYVAPERLSVAATAAVQHAVATGGHVLFSAVTLVELLYLIEKRRFPRALLRMIDRDSGDLTTGMVAIPLDQTVAHHARHIPRDVVPDMPDRIIAATALALGAPLITRDHAIRSSAVHTMW